MRGWIYALILGGIGFFIWHTLHKHDQRRDADIKSTTLKETEQTKIIVDSARHTITTVARAADGQTTTSSTFFRNNASVSVGLDKSVLVTARTWGTETSPFVGCAIGSDLMGRAAVGLNLFYVRRWELGGGLLLSTDIRDTRAFAHVSYNAYNNIYVAVGVDSQRTAHLMAGLKF